LYAQPNDDDDDNTTNNNDAVMVAVVAPGTSNTTKLVVRPEAPVYALPDNYDDPVVVAASATKHATLLGNNEPIRAKPPRVTAAGSDVDDYALPTAMQVAPVADPIYNEVASI
jgi:hypothetical protein